MRRRLGFFIFIVLDRIIFFDTNRGIVSDHSVSSDVFFRFEGNQFFFVFDRVQSKTVRGVYNL